jgi:hypothetical protein
MSNGLAYYAKNVNDARKMFYAFGEGTKVAAKLSV